MTCGHWRAHHVPGTELPGGLSAAMALRPFLSWLRARQCRASTELLDNGATSERQERDPRRLGKQAPVWRYHYLGYRPGTTGLIRRRGLDRAKLGRASCAPGSEHIPANNAAMVASRRSNT